MKFRNIFLITIILLAALSISAVSAENATVDDNVDVVSNDTPSVPVTNDTGTVIPDTPVNTTNNTTGDIENGTADNTTDNVTGDIENGTADNTTDSNQTEDVPSSIVCEDLTKYYSSKDKFNAIFFDAEGNPLANTNVTLYINGVTYNRTTDENGSLSFSVNLGPGEYEITVMNPVTGESVTNKVTVLSTIYGENVVKYYKNGTQYYATFLDENGNPLANTNITFNINGVFYTRQTNENGTARLNINLNPNTYILTAKNPINNQEYSNNITVLGTISGENVVKYYKNGTQYYATFLDENGNPLANTNITFNINGVFYTRQTNENGTARLNINLDPGFYIITAINPINNDLYSNNITVLSLINGSDYTTTYKTNGSYAVTVVDETGKPVVNETVVFNINGVFYQRVTDENGTARLNINLDPGSYIITAEWKGCKHANTINVNKRQPALSVVNSTVKQNGNIQVKLTYANQPISGATVYFVFSFYQGQAFGAITNSDGIASIPLQNNYFKASPGTYSLNTGIQNNPFYQNIMIMTSFTVTY